MHFHALDWSLFGLYFLTLFYVSFRESRGEASDIENYLLAGRKLTLPSFIATTVSTWYGGILGVGEYSYSYGLSNWLVFGLPYYLGAFIFGAFIARHANKARLLTIPDQIGAAYGSKMAVGAAFYVFIMTVPAAYVLMLGVLIKLIFGTSLAMGVIIATVFTTIYVFIGGFKADLRNDWFNFILMFGAIAVVLVVLRMEHGGVAFLKANAPEMHFKWHGGNTGAYILSWYLIALSALIEPSFYQRVYAAESPKTARWGILLSIPLWILFDFMTTSLGLYSRAILGSGINGMDAFPLIADKALGPGMKAFFFIGMFATIQSTVDSYSLLAASTLSHDILWKARRIRDRISEVWLTRGALIVSAIASVWIALAAKSVIDIWNRIGSLGTPGLMLPLALSYWPNWKYRKEWAAVNFVTAPAVVGYWFYQRGLSESPAFPFTIEPIYVGIAIALVLLGLDHLTRSRPHRG